MPDIDEVIMVWEKELDKLDDGKSLLSDSGATGLYLKYRSDVNMLMLYNTFFHDNPDYLTKFRNVETRLEFVVSKAKGRYYAKRNHELFRAIIYVCIAIIGVIIPFVVKFLFF